MSLLAPAMERLQPWAGTLAGPEWIHEGFKGIRVFVGDANALANHLVNWISDDAYERCECGAAREVTPSAPSKQARSPEKMTGYDEATSGNQFGTGVAL